MRNYCVAICQLSDQPQEDFDVNMELLVLEGKELHVATWDAEPRDGGFDILVLNDRVSALGFMVVTDWEFLEEKGLRGGGAAGRRLRAVRPREPGCATQPGVGITRPPVQHNVRPLSRLSFQPGYQGTDDVGGQRVHQLTQLRLPDKTLNPGEVGVVQQSHPRLQQHYRPCGLEDGDRPQLSAEGSDVIVNQVTVAAYMSRMVPRTAPTHAP